MYRSPLATSNRLVWKKGPQSRGQGESLLLHAPPLAPSDLDLRTCASFCCRRPPQTGNMVLSLGGRCPGGTRAKGLTGQGLRQPEEADTQGGQTPRVYRPGKELFFYPTRTGKH